MYSVTEFLHDHWLLAGGLFLWLFLKKTFDLFLKTV